jgi:hypothetical protein
MRGTYGNHGAADASSRAVATKPRHRPADGRLAGRSRRDVPGKEPTMTRTIFAAVALAIAAVPALASEQPHPGFVTPTYAGGFVGPHSGESAGGFDLSRAMPLYSGGHTMDQQGAEGGSSFDAMMATKVGRGLATSTRRG